MKAPISICIICKNEGERLKNCILSFKDYVAEIVVVDTGSDDTITHEIAKQYADKFEIYTECNNSETGEIDDFSKARNRALELASYSWVGWFDADDEVKNAHLLNSLIDKANEKFGISVNKQILLPYEYSHDNNGNVNCLHYRERLVYPAKKFSWQNPVHEVLLCNENCDAEFSDEVLVVHKRISSGKQINPLRNFRILRKLVDEIGDSDPRQLYYLGLEYGNIGDLPNAIKTLKRYTELSGWDDEKCLAELKIAQHYTELNELNNSIEWGLRSLNTKETWAETYFHLARTYYIIADAAEKKNENAYKFWDKCINFAKIGLSLPPTKTVLFVSPAERIDIHRFLNFALNKTGRIQEALDSTNLALQSIPNDPSLLMNKKVYEEALLKISFMDIINKLESVNILSSDKKQSILDILNAPEKKN